MSSPAVQTRSRVTRIAQEAVEKARLSVVPRVRTRAPQVPFMTLVSLVLISGVVGLLLFNTSMQQASFAATVARGGGRQPRRSRADPADGARGPAQPAARRDAGADMGMVMPAAPAFLGLERQDRGEKVPALPENAIHLRRRRRSSRRSWRPTRRS